MEREIREFLRAGKVKLPEFEAFASAFILLDAEIKEQKTRFAEHMDDGPTAYLRFKRIQTSLRELKPTAARVDSLLKTVGRIKPPIKFEVTPHSLIINLLDSSFLPSLAETLQKPGEATPKGDSSLHVRRLSNVGRTAPPEDNSLEGSGVVLNEKFNVHQSSRSRTKAATLSLVDSVSPRTPTHASNPKPTRTGLFQPQRISVSRTNLANDAPTEGDVNLYNFKNLYETKGKPAVACSHRLTSLLKAKEAVEDSPHRNYHTSSSRTRDAVASSGVYASVKAKVLDKTMVRRSSFNDLKFSAKYQKNVISIEDDTGVVSGQFCDESKLRNILSTFKAVPKNVRRIEMVGNTFVCNPVLVFKSAVTERSALLIVLDLSQNKLLCSVSHSKRDVEALKALNVEVLN